MARTNLQFRREAPDAVGVNAFESGTRPVARRLFTRDPEAEGDRRTMPAPTQTLAALAESSVTVSSMAPVASSDAPTVRPPAFRPMIVPVARDESSIPPTRPSLSVLRFGSLDRVPFALQPSRDLRHISLDHREAFVLSRVDGQADIEAVLDSTPMPTHRVLHILSGLIDRGLIALK